MRRVKPKFVLLLIYFSRPSRPKLSFRFVGRRTFIVFIDVVLVSIPVVVEFGTMRRIEFWASSAVLR